MAILLLGLVFQARSNFPLSLPPPPGPKPPAPVGSEGMGIVTIVLVLVLATRRTLHRTRSVVLTISMFIKGCVLIQRVFLLNAVIVPDGCTRVTALRFQHQRRVPIPE